VPRHAGDAEHLARVGRVVAQASRPSCEPHSSVFKCASSVQTCVTPVPAVRDGLVELEPHAVGRVRRPRPERVARLGVVGSSCPPRRAYTGPRRVPGDCRGPCPLVAATAIRRHAAPCGFPEGQLGQPRWSAPSGGASRGARGEPPPGSTASATPGGPLSRERPEDRRVPARPRGERARTSGVARPGRSGEVWRGRHPAHARAGAPRAAVRPAAWLTFMRAPSREERECARACLACNRAGPHARARRRSKIRAARRPGAAP